MSVLKSKRKQSRLEVFHHAYRLRREMTDLLMRDFGYKAPSFDKTMREEKKTKVLNLHKWFIEDELQEGNLVEVHVDYIKHKNMICCNNFKVNGKQHLIIRPLTERELKDRDIEAKLEYIAMMGDVDL